MSVYSELGLRRVVNATFPLTRLGGTILSDEVLEAMAEANRGYCSLWDLEERAGEVISEITGAEAAWITPGAFAGLVLSAAACIAGKDPEKMKKLPNTEGMKDEIVIQRCNRFLIYDRSMEVPGGKLVQVGDERSGCTPDLIEAAITDKTAAIHYAIPLWPKPEVAPLEDVVKVAHAHGVPVIVDAAGQTHPIEGLSKYTEMGCDLVCYGGKYVGGPNSTGFVIGRKDLVEAVALHSFIGAESGPLERPGYWRSIGRGYKLDRQEIVGLLVALRRWVELDHERVRIQPAWEKVRRIESHLRGLQGLSDVRFDYVPRSGEGCGYHVIGLEMSFNRTAADVKTITKRLREDDPEVWVRQRGGNSFIINTLYLMPGDEQIIVERFAKYFG
ncbi:MAG: aminotransferase class V-fold PLP-dependent enzyme [Candidatus Bathyarchaeota archaeon]|nr:MAG: aminotransferase class V-fold PLP-dependent enzyme [Candidatus Bathyarchaeota archaeon]